MRMPSRHRRLLVAAGLISIACGDGATGHSKVDQNKSTTALTLEDEQAMCHAYADYVWSVIDSPDKWCRWQGQNNATGTADSELQASCASAESVCLTRKEEEYQAAQERLRDACDGTNALSSTLMYSYSTCDTTVALVEACGAEQIDILDDLRAAPCSEYTVALRTAINMELGAPSCQETGCR